MVGFDDEETKTRFTNYSMSSSIIRRNKELSLLDDKFERSVFRMILILLFFFVLILLNRFANYDLILFTKIMDYSMNSNVSCIDINLCSLVAQKGRLFARSEYNNLASKRWHLLFLKSTNLYRTIREK